MKLYDMTDELMEILQDGGYYDTHCLAMTKEGLHSKMDIIGQLAKRDREIYILKEQFELANDVLREITGTVKYSDPYTPLFCIENTLDTYDEKLVEIYSRNRSKEPF